MVSATQTFLTTWRVQLLRFLLLFILLALAVTSSGVRPDRDETSYRMTFNKSGQGEEEQKPRSKMQGRVSKCMADDAGRGPYRLPCVFPFVYKGITYESCATVESSAPWCRTAWGLSDWGFCDDSEACLTDTVQQDSSDSSNPVCSSDDGGIGAYTNQCIFPFTYKGATYNSCTSAEHDHPWCRNNGRKSDWGNCENSLACATVDTSPEPTEVPTFASTTFPSCLPSASSKPSLSTAPSIHPTDILQTTSPTKFLNPPSTFSPTERSSSESIKPTLTLPSLPPGTSLPTVITTTRPPSPPSTQPTSNVIPTPPVLPPTPSNNPMSTLPPLPSLQTPQPSFSQSPPSDLPTISPQSITPLPTPQPSPPPSSPPIAPMATVTPMPDPTDQPRPTPQRTRAPSPPPTSRPNDGPPSPPSTQPTPNANPTPPVLSTTPSNNPMSTLPPLPSLQTPQPSFSQNPPSDLPTIPSPQSIAPLPTPLLSPPPSSTPNAPMATVMPMPDPTDQPRPTPQRTRAPSLPPTSRPNDGTQQPPPSGPPNQTTQPRPTSLPSVESMPQLSLQPNMTPTPPPAARPTQLPRPPQSPQPTQPQTPQPAIIGTAIPTLTSESLLPTFQSSSLPSTTESLLPTFQSSSLPSTAPNVELPSTTFIPTAAVSAPTTPPPSQSGRPESEAPSEVPTTDGINIFPSVDLSPITLFLLTGPIQTENRKSGREEELLGIMQKNLLAAYSKALDEDQKVVGMQLILVDETILGEDPIILVEQILGRVFFAPQVTNLPSRQELDQITRDTLESDEFLHDLQNADDPLLSQTQSVSVQFPTSPTPTTAPVLNETTSDAATASLIAAIIALVLASALGYFILTRSGTSQHDIHVEAPVPIPSSTGTFGLLEQQAGVMSDVDPLSTVAEGEEEEETSVARDNAIHATDTLGGTRPPYRLDHDSLIEPVPSTAIEEREIS